jgi:2-octaprenyl-6-methoxyphenol hydroxylase
MSDIGSSQMAATQHGGRMSVDVVVVGAGPAGLTAAIALASAGVECALVGGRPTQADNRTTALLAGSVNALAALGVWDRCRDAAAALTSITIIDDTPRLLRAPEVTFTAAEIGLAAFGHNIENRHLVAALEARADALAHLARIAEQAEAIEIDDNEVRVRLAGGGMVIAPLVIGADGRNSLTRAAAGIGSTRHDYSQTALTLNLGHARPHDGATTEFHRTSGPFTLVPLPGQRSSLVCVVEPEEAERLAALPDGALNEAIEARAHSILGKVVVEPGRGLFRLGVERAQRFAANRAALVGEAAHVIPPIGAQGLNLGLRDAAAIAELVVAARRAGDDPGSPELLGRYDLQRRADVTSRAVAVDLLNRSLLSDLLPVQGLRGLGLWMLDRVGPLRRAVMREGVTPRLAEPRLMRGEVL